MMLRSLLWPVLLSWPLAVFAQPASAPTAPSPQPPGAPAPWFSACERLLDGVRQVAAPGVPGPIAVFGRDAFPVVVGKTGKKELGAVVAAGLAGEGRIVAFGHDGFGSAEAGRIADTGRLLVNAIRWAAGRNSDGGPPIRVDIHGGELAGESIEENIATRGLQRGEFDQALPDADVLLCFRSDLDPKDLPAIDRFLERGGGLIVGVCGWGWEQLNPGKRIQDNPLNQIVARAGLAFTDQTLERTTPDGYRVDGPPPPLCNGSLAIDALYRWAEAGAAPGPQADMAQACWSATLAVRFAPPAAGLRRRQERPMDPPPTAERPITVKDGLRRVYLALDADGLADAAPPVAVAHPAAEAFPGPVPADAPRVERTITIDTSVPRWRSTGLYAPPGGTIECKLPKSALAAGLKLRIGAHTDKLWDHESWKRVPEIATAAALTKPTTEAASPFGGLIYIDVPAGCKAGSVPISIGGAVEAPLFVLDQTTPDAWRDIRQRPAPWAELATSKIILTVPSSAVRNVDDPEALLRFWDRVMDSQADLATIPRERPSPERIVTDVQISAGYMHAGYPIMTHLDVVEMATTLDKLRGTPEKNAWGFFHELGHNHQSPDWTFGGAGEVTCNLFTMYTLETVCGIRGADAHEAMRKRDETVRRYLALGGGFERWKADPFLALAMYAQLQEAFGWDAFKKVFAEYRALPRDQRPRSDDERRDQWLTRFSRAAGRNLGPFFEAWGVPTSEAARAAIADLPPWMPPGFPP